jgi:hypothetical protein
MPDLVPDDGSIQLAPDPGSIQAPGQPQTAPAPQQPGGFASLGRGVIQGATLGYSDEISGAIESLFSDKTYQQARDESRAANEQAKAAHPFLYGGGEIGGGIASAFVPGLGIAKGAGLAKTALTLGAQGGAAALGGSTAELTGPNRDIGGAIKDTAVGFGLGAGIGAAAHGLSSVLASAPEKAMADRAANVAQGSGTKGSATLTIKKALARDPEAIDKALTTSFESETSKKPIALERIMRESAKDVLPVVEERASQVAAKLGPVYKAADKVEGGLSLHNFINHVDDEIATLSKNPENEKLVETLADAKRSALKAWAPELEQKLASNATANKLGLVGQMFKNLDEVRIPYQDFRSWVSHLQKEGTNGTRTIMDMKAAQAAKMKLGTNLRDFLMSDLEALAERHPDAGISVEKLAANNREYSALANIQDAVESRFWKENAGNSSGKGHAAQLIGAGIGALAGGAIPIPGVGHAIGAAVGGAVGAKAASGLAGAGQSATKTLANAHSKIAELAARAAAGDVHAKALLHAIHGSPQIMSRLAGLHAHSLTEGM